MINKKSEDLFGKEKRMTLKAGGMIMKMHCISVCASMCMVILFAGTVWTEQPQGAPPPDAQALWEHVTEVDPYTGWGYWPGHEGFYSGKSPHGKYLKLFANSRALKAVREGKTEMPNGSIIMKANYAKDKETLKSLTPMYKVEEFHPEGGDWFWAKYKPDGEALVSGKVDGCIDCHRSRKDQDWIFTPTQSE
jgi:hypothetical protein